MPHAPAAQFIHQTEIQSAIHPKSSKAEIQAVWEQYGYLRPNSMDKFNSGHFLRSALAGITTEAQVLAFIESLEEDARAYTGPSAKCTKAQEARNALRRYYEVKAIRGADFSTRIEDVLKDARRTCCHCHETGSYSPRTS